MKIIAFTVPYPQTAISDTTITVPGADSYILNFAGDPDDDGLIIYAVSDGDDADSVQLGARVVQFQGTPPAVSVQAGYDKFIGNAEGNGELYSLFLPTGLDPVTNQPPPTPSFKAGKDL